MSSAFQKRSIKIVWLSSMCLLLKQQTASDAKSCQIPACMSMKDMLKASTAAAASQAVKMADKSLVSEVFRPAGYEGGCPVHRELLGTSTWNLLHTLAANFPEHPNTYQKEEMAQFVTILSKIYPCQVCAQDFKNSVAANPPR
jgi:FAD-linked sulfhydryl oxidase